MRQPWIYNRISDCIFILSPPFVVLAIIFLFQKQLMVLNASYSFYTWLFLIVFVDVAHVYSTLFKTYFVKEEFQRRKLLYLGIPALSFVLGIIFYQFGSLVFWSALALVAVYHFIRQQYGFMRLYARFEPNNIHKKIDAAAVYAATIYPMLYWFTNPRKFTWFVEHEFSWMGNLEKLLPIFTFIYLAILSIWLIKTIILFIRFKTFNIPKDAVIAGSFLSWYFGIVYFNNDLIFTFLNVVSHGVPYMALIYLNEIQNKKKETLKGLVPFRSGIGVLMFIAALMIIAFSEEFLWEVLVWKENISISTVHTPDYLLMILVPLLTVPQLTHYLLDGFIWKRKKKLA